VRTGSLHQLRLQGGRVLAYRQQPGDGTPLVLLHGLYDNSSGWEVFARGSQRPLICFDLPGFGASDPPAVARYDSYAAAICEGIAALSLERFLLVGHSLGGAVATAVSERLHEQVLGLVLLAPCGYGRQLIPELLMTPGMRPLLDRALPLGMAHPLTARAIYLSLVSYGQPPDAAALARFTDAARRCQPGIKAGTEAIVAGGLAPDAFYRRALTYPGPVSALWGECDRLVPLSHSRGVKHAFPQASLTVWPRMGHHPQAERPGALDRFIEDCALAATSKDGQVKPGARAPRRPL
jgi:pimeloyl-ACP methyl ester carboxylesterase